MPADWQLPPGVPRSIWEFAADPRIARDEDDHLAHAPLLEFDRHIVTNWFTNPGRLIDLGCGTGRSLLDFASRGFACTGVDLSQPSLRIARRKLRDRSLSAELLRGNLCELDCLAADSFEYALLLFGTLGMVAGIDGRTQVLQQCRRLLRPGGRLALHVHSLWPHLFLPGSRRWLAVDLWKRLRNSPEAGDTRRDYRGIPQIYHHVFSRREIRRLLCRNGFAITHQIPLRPVSEDLRDSSLEQTGRFRNLRATGWLIEAIKS